MNKVLASSLAAAFGLSVAGCAMDVDQPETDKSVNAAVDGDGNQGDKTEKTGKQTDKVPSEIKVKSDFTGADTCW